MAMVLLSSVLIGLAISMFRHAHLGLPPYDVLVSSISRHSALSFGQAAWVLAAVFYSAAALLGQRPKLVGLLWVFANGLMVDAMYPLLRDPSHLAGRIGLAAAAIATLSLAISVIAHSASTGGAFELLTRAAEERNVGPRRFRTGLEVAVLSLGIIAGGAFGPATLVHALAISWTIGAASQGLADHRAGRQHRLATAVS
ncbi:MAG: hypothetical protein KJO07_09705 [Deltaproteobacteria bacterium]|nr:hypothetical protein [Deltaproteobacteria bacterium]